MQWGVEVVEPVVESEDEDEEDEGDGQQITEMLRVVVEMRVGVLTIRWDVLSTGLDVRIAISVESSVESDRSSVVSLSVIELAMVVMESDSSVMVLMPTSCTIESDVFSVVSLSMVVSESKLSKAATRSPEIQASDLLSILRLEEVTSMSVVKVVMVDRNMKYSSMSVIFEIFL